MTCPKTQIRPQFPQIRPKFALKCALKCAQNGEVFLEISANETGPFSTHASSTEQTKEGVCRSSSKAIVTGGEDVSTKNHLHTTATAESAFVGFRALDACA